jgi:hypothetical protein
MSGGRELLKRCFECHPEEMKRETLLGYVGGLVLVCCIVAAAQDKGNWRAASSTAKSITGDVGLTEEKVGINFSSFTIARIRGLQAPEASALFDADTSGGGNGNVYRLSIPSTKTFLHKNTLCGTEETQWMVSYAVGRSLQLAFFSGATPPVFTLEALASSSDMCGTFSYVR